jgi:hypothetical protein
MATLQAGSRNVASDETRTAGNEDRIRHEMSPDQFLA